MAEWVDVTQSFSEMQRHYRDSYLEFDEIIDNTIEVSLFSKSVGLYDMQFEFLL